MLAKLDVAEYHTRLSNFTFLFQMSIEFQNVAFAYGDRPILHNVNFSIEQGKFAAIMGGSGSGKTTLMRVITGQLSPTSGTILINGENLADFSAARLREHRRKMGVLFQHGALFTDLNVYDNIAFPMRELTQLPEEMIRHLVILKLHAVGLRGVEKLMPAELSGGMARRVALARTIALDPDLILYDEPFTGLDPISLGVIAHLIHRANKALRSTSIMVTHDVGHSLQLVDQIIFLAHGEILFSGSPQEMEQSDSEWIRQFVQGLPNGPVAFRYPAETTLKQDLLS